MSGVEFAALPPGEFAPQSKQFTIKISFDELPGKSRELF